MIILFPKLLYSHCYKKITIQNRIEQVQRKILECEIRISNNRLSLVFIILPKQFTAKKFAVVLSPSDICIAKGIYSGIESRRLYMFAKRLNNLITSQCYFTENILICSSAKQLKMHSSISRIDLHVYWHFLRTLMMM